MNLSRFVSFAFLLFLSVSLSACGTSDLTTNTSSTDTQTADLLTDKQKAEGLVDMTRQVANAGVILQSSATIFTQTQQDIVEMLVESEEAGASKLMTVHQVAFDTIEASSLTDNWHNFITSETASQYEFTTHIGTVRLSKNNIDDDVFVHAEVVVNLVDQQATIVHATLTASVKVANLDQFNFDALDAAAVDNISDIFTTFNLSASAVGTSSTMLFDGTIVAITEPNNRITPTTVTLTGYLHYDNNHHTINSHMNLTLLSLPFSFTREGYTITKNGVLYADEMLLTSTNVTFKNDFQNSIKELVINKLSLRLIKPSSTESIEWLAQLSGTNAYRCQGSFNNYFYYECYEGISFNFSAVNGIDDDVLSSVIQPLREDIIARFRSYYYSFPNLPSLTTSAWHYELSEDNEEITIWLDPYSFYEFETPKTAITLDFNLETYATSIEELRFEIKAELHQPEAMEVKFSYGNDVMTLKVSSYTDQKSGEVYQIRQFEHNNGAVFIMDTGKITDVMPIKVGDNILATVTINDSGVYVVRYTDGTVETLQ